MNHWVAVTIGGAIGSLCRYGIALWLPLIFNHSTLMPWHTLVANGFGCFLIGFVTPLTDLPTSVQRLLITGFLGGLTTFSTLEWELFHLSQQTQWSTLFLYLLLTLTLGFSLVWAGYTLSSQTL